MTNLQISNRQLIELVKNYWHWRWLWLATTVSFAILSVVFVLFVKSDVWVSSQGLIVRDEASGGVMRLGRFQSQTEMKAAQETVLEMARNTQVLTEALQKVGREPRLFGLWTSNSDPTQAEIESLAKDGIEVRAPRGAELGTTEVIYLDVKQQSRERAVALNRAVCDSLERHLKLVRKSRADGVISELTSAQEVAISELKRSTETLKRMESSAGADLSDLRGLTDAGGGGNSNRQVLDVIKSELRRAEIDLQQQLIDLNIARELHEQPEQLLTTPGRLVNSQPGLRRLREGLSEAAINTSELQGRYEMSHPLVQAAIQTENRIRDQLRVEIGMSVQTLTKDVEITEKQIAQLKQQEQQLEQRLTKLADIRAEYANVISEVRARNQQLQDTERELAQARASRDAADTSSLITRLDEPIIGEKPIGPGRSTIVMGATFGGLFFGLGVVFLLTPLDNQMNFGRRRQDSTVGRRASDLSGVINFRAENEETAPVTKGVSEEGRDLPLNAFSQFNSRSSDSGKTLRSETVTQAMSEVQKQAVPNASSSKPTHGKSDLSEPRAKMAPVEVAENVVAEKIKSPIVERQASQVKSMKDAQAIIAAALKPQKSADAAGNS